jgi:hypothetical protein
MTANEMTRPLSEVLRAILGAGAIVGTMDAVAASVYSYVLRGGTPAGVFRYVASGVFGKLALTAGGGMAALGLLFHFTVAIGWTGLYFVLAPKLRASSGNMVANGVVYGLLVWLAMNLVVVPLSNASPAPIRFAAPTLIMVLIHLFVIGVPISYLAQRYSAK